MVLCDYYIALACRMLNDGFLNGRLLYRDFFLFFSFSSFFIYIATFVPRVTTTTGMSCKFLQPVVTDLLFYWVTVEICWFMHMPTCLWPAFVGGDSTWCKGSHYIYTGERWLWQSQSRWTLDEADFDLFKEGIFDGGKTIQLYQLDKTTSNNKLLPT